mmetsp:Transcript_29291/g.93433  ORF Transcript_29291/g.93433 Transcript_29291/m.93433 type:complete len:392 (-) Transcript_29291:149-1324(-)
MAGIDTENIACVTGRSAVAVASAPVTVGDPADRSSQGAIAVLDAVAGSAHWLPGALNHLLAFSTEAVRFRAVTGAACSAGMCSHSLGFPCGLFGAAAGRRIDSGGAATVLCGLSVSVCPIAANRATCGAEALVTRAGAAALGGAPVPVGVYLGAHESVSLGTDSGLRRTPAKVPTQPGARAAGGSSASLVAHRHSAGPPAVSGHRTGGRGGREPRGEPDLLELGCQPGRQQLPVQLQHRGVLPADAQCCAAEAARFARGAVPRAELSLEARAAGGAGPQAASGRGARPREAPRALPRSGLRGRGEGEAAARGLGQGERAANAGAGQRRRTGEGLVLQQRRHDAAGASAQGAEHEDSAGCGTCLKPRQRIEAKGPGEARFRRGVAAQAHLAL